MPDHERSDSVLLVRGGELERWMLKLLCGLYASGWAQTGTGALPDWSPPRTWLEVLFGQEDVPEPGGLYVPITKGQMADNEIHLFPSYKLDDPSRMLLGCLLAGVPFLFAMGDAELSDGGSVNGVRVRYRPQTVIYEGRYGSREINFGWREGTIVKMIFTPS